MSRGVFKKYLTTFSLGLALDFASTCQLEIEHMIEIQTTLLSTWIESG